MAKKIVDEDMVLNIIINGDKGRAELNKLERAIKDLSIANEELAVKKTRVEQRMKKLETAGKKDSIAYKNMETEVRQLSSAMDRNQQAIEQARQRMETLRRGLDLTKMTITDLRSEIARLTKLRNTATPGTEQWKAYDRQLAQVVHRYAEVKREGDITKGALCKMADGINKYWNMVVSGLGSFAGIFFSIKGAVSKFVEFEDILSDTRKTTGLTKREVLELNETLKSINTRTGQEELQGLARIGGKLGIEGKANLEGFVRAADQINVTLKEDLGGDTEETIRQVGKLVDIFKVKDDFGIEQGLLKVGSVINELGAASTANEGFIVEFSKRVAGVAPSAGISVDAIMGLAATLDQFGQQAEASSSVYTQMMANMFKNTATYADIAGMSLGEFSDLMNTNANEAFIRVLEGLKGNNEGMETLVRNLGDMQLNGVRATTILGTLADNTATLRAQQKLANEAFREGTSLTDEFNIKNNNAAAQAEKQKKLRDELIRDLGEKLQPILVSGNSLMTTVLKTLNTLTGFMLKYGATLVKITSLIAAYVAAVKLATLWETKLKSALDKKAVSQKLDTLLTAAQTAGTHLLATAKALLTGNIKKAVIAFKAFSLAIKANPIGLLVTAVIAAGMAIYKLATRTNEAEKAMKRVKQAEDEFQKSLALEQIVLDRLFGTLEGTKEGTAEWAKARKAITDKYGQYLSDLGLEIDSLEDARKAYNALSLAIRETAMEKAKEQASQNAAKNLVDTEVEQMRKIKEAIDDTYKDAPAKAAKYFQQMKAELEKGGTMSRNMTTIMFNAGIEKNIAKLQEAKDAYKKEMQAINAIFSVTSPVPESTEKTTDNKVNNSPTHTPEKSSVPDYDEQIINLKQNYAARKLTQEEYEKKLDNLELAHLQYRLKTFEGTEEKRLELQQKIADKQISIREKQDKEENSRTAGYIRSVLAENDSSLRKEEEAYAERLRKAGIYGKDKEKMTKDEFTVLEILQRQHEINLQNIEDDARKKRNSNYLQQINTRIKNAETANKIELSQMQIRHNEELYTPANAGELEKIQKQQAKETLDLTARQAGEMVDLINDIFMGIDTDELNLGEQILTDDEKQALLEKLTEVQLKASEIKLSTTSAGKPDTSPNTDVDILGMSSSQWKDFFQHLEDGKLGIEDLQNAVTVLSSAWSAYSQLRSAQEKKELKEYEKNTKKKKAALDRQLESGQISQEQYNARTAQLDADLDAKEEEIAQKQAAREKRMALFQTTMNLASGLVRLWVSPGFPVAIPMSAILSALGAVQIATITAAQYARGKYPVIGENDGHTYQADYTGDNLKTGIYQKPTLGLFSEKEPEMVVDGTTTRKLVFDYPQIYQSIMAISQGRTPQFSNGNYPVTPDKKSDEYIVSAASDPDFKQLLKENLEMMKALKEKKIEIPWYGKGGIDEKMKKATKYERQISTRS